jgi:N-acetyl-anhydromuramyl-L-alanine amidase AmpD
MTLPIHWTGSSNCYKDRHAYLPEAIVIHRLDRSLESTDDLFAQPGAGTSLHYAVGITGEIHQYVHDADTAWHCGKVYAPSWKGLKSVSPGTFINPNYYTIGIGVETRPGTEIPQLVYLTVAELIRSLCLKWNIPAGPDHIVAHSAINSGVNSPGNSVNFTKLLGLVTTEPAQPETPSAKPCTW